MAMLDDNERDELLLSCRYGDLDDVKAAVDKHGYAILDTTRDENQNTVLHMISANGHLDLLIYLLPLVSPSLLAAQNSSGSTPLHWAALNSQLEVAKALVEFPAGPGVDLIDIKNKVGHSPLADAEFSGWEEGAKWLVEVMKLEPNANGQETDDVVAVADQDIQVEIEDASGQVAKLNLSSGSSKSSTTSAASPTSATSSSS